MNEYLSDKEEFFVWIGLVVSAVSLDSTVVVVPVDSSRSLLYDDLGVIPVER